MEYNYPNPTTSVAGSLLPAVGEAIKRIAPERLADIEGLTANITLEVKEEKAFRCEALSLGLIIFSTRTIELTWACSYAYYVFHSRIVAGKRPAGTVVSLSEHIIMQQTGEYYSTNQHILQKFHLNKQTE